MWNILTGSELDGHKYVEKEIHHNKSVSICECEICGKRNFVWGERHILEDK